MKSGFEPGLTSKRPTELVEVEENDKLVREEWPKNPTLVICFTNPTQVLRTYELHHSVGRGTPISDAEDSEVQGCAAMVPRMTISLCHGARSLTSLGRTAITGGSDATIRTWDIITGECLQVLIGHLAAGMTRLLHMMFAGLTDYYLCHTYDL